MGQADARYWEDLMDRLFEIKKLWRFFENCPEYEGQSVDDRHCKRWQDTLTLASYIRSSLDPSDYSCEPGRMSYYSFYEFRDHNGETGYESTDYYIRMLSEQEYLDARARKGSDTNTEDEMYFLTRTFSLTRLAEDLLEDDYLIVKTEYLHGSSLQIVSRCKNLSGYYLFSFSRSTA